MRSLRFPSAPPRTSESATTVHVSRACMTARTRITESVSASSANTIVAFVKRLNAPPEFRVRWSSTSVPMIESGASESALTTQDFVI